MIAISTQLYYTLKEKHNIYQAAFTEAGCLLYSTRSAASAADASAAAATAVICFQNSYY